MDDRCFACGSENQSGLQLKITENAEGVIAEFTPPDWSQGYDRVVHGGIVATILDEMAVWAAYKKGHRSVTAGLTMRIRKAMVVGDRYTAYGKVTGIRHKLVQADAKIKDKNGEIVASADVKLMKIS